MIFQDRPTTGLFKQGDKAVICGTDSSMDGLSVEVLGNGENAIVILAGDIVELPTYLVQLLDQPYYEQQLGPFPCLAQCLMHIPPKCP